MRVNFLPARNTPATVCVVFAALSGGKPVRASKQSAEWCRKAVEPSWSQKERTYAAAEKADALAAYDHAREVDDRIVAESVAD